MDHYSSFSSRFFIRLLCLLLCLALLPAFALAEGIELTDIPSPIRPGKSERYVFTSAEADTALIRLLDTSENTVTVISVSQNIHQGENYFIWDGMTAEGTAVAPGNYTLRFEMADGNQAFPVTVGEPAPQITGIVLQDVAPDGSLSGTVTCSENGTVQITLKLEDSTPELLSFSVLRGENSFTWDGRLEGAFLTEGEYTLRFSLTDASGVSGTRQSRTIEYPDMGEIASTEENNAENTQSASAERHAVIPSTVTTQADENNYWTYPIGELDDEKIWEILMQPMTVIDGNQQEVYPLRATPDASKDKSNIVGEVTYASQGVHVLETLDNGWTYVEVYNSSYGPNCKSRRGYGVTNELIRGYVKTSLLKTIQPYAKIGLVIDKLNQTMYIYEDGKCTGTLLVSTGLNNKTQSWNETPSGEFVMISKIGGFEAGNLYCRYGMRINGGCCIHEVPYIGKADTPAAQRDYSSQLRVLGQKASHGCIRVQKASNDAGQNIKWLWDNLKINTKVLIWEDSGRYVEYPDDSTPLYYNPTGGKNYHENQNCSAVKDRYLPLTPFTYGELDTGIYAALTPCSTCCHTIKRKSEIDALNQANGF